MTANNFINRYLKTKICLNILLSSAVRWLLSFSQVFLSERDRSRSLFGGSGAATLSVTAAWEGRLRNTAENRFKSLNYSKSPYARHINAILLGL